MNRERTLEARSESERDPSILRGLMTQALNPFAPAAADKWYFTTQWQSRKRRAKARRRQADSFSRSWRKGLRRTAPDRE
jgi:hypothetical protein